MFRHRNVHCYHRPISNYWMRLSMIWLRRVLSSKMNNNLQDLHNSSHHTKDESNNCFNYPFKTICTLKHACLDWVPSQFVCSSANSGYKRKFSSSCHPLTCIFTVLPVFRQKFGCFLFTKGVKFSAIFSSSTKIAELTQPRPQWSLSCRPFSRR